MQPMSWNLSRLGSRFGLLLEPHLNRVMHGATGRFLDQPLDLAVGLVDSEGRERLLPFTRDARRPAMPGAPSEDAEPRQRPGSAGGDRPPPLVFYNVEQFDRLNSVTFRGYAEQERLRFEFNLHAPFYPQSRRLSITPAFYLEVRVHAVERIRKLRASHPVPEEVELFIRLKRPGTRLREGPNTLDLAYDAPRGRSDGVAFGPDEASADQRMVTARERLISLNPDTHTWCEGSTGGLNLRLPVTPPGSGTKWRLVWAAHVADPVLDVGRTGSNGQRLMCPAQFAYTDYYADVDAVATAAVQNRDDWLALSRLFERVVDQAPLDQAQQHLLNQSFQNYLLNTFWCTGRDASRQADFNGEPDPRGEAFPWFSVWEGSSCLHSSLDIEYSATPFYLTIWPDLLRLQLNQWASHAKPHAESRGAVVPHDLGRSDVAGGQASPLQMDVEENSNYLLMLQAYTRWTGDIRPLSRNLTLIRQLIRYLIWTDRDGSGFPTVPTLTTFNDADPATRLARKQTYLAVKRLAGLRAGADCLRLANAVKRRNKQGLEPELRERITHEARQLDSRIERDLRNVERASWLGDHYVVAADDSALEIRDPETGSPLPFERMPGTDAYSIHTGNALLLPAMLGQPPMLNPERLRRDLLSSSRENRGPYGSAHSSFAPGALRVSGNLWRDMLARYHGMDGPSNASAYWDLQVMSNTSNNSLGFSDAYLNDHLTHYPRGIVSFGYFLSTPRLQIDRLAPGGAYITVDPNRSIPQRWPLLPLADWAARKIPVCVVGNDGRVTIEAPTDPVIVHGKDPGQTVSGLEMIG